jgi:hypothetical protein
METKLSAREVFQNSVISIAAQRLGRPLSDMEVKGIRSISSLMMLEAMEREFESVDICSAEHVEKQLEYFAVMSLEL